MCGTRLSLATERRDKAQPGRQAPLWQLDVAALGFAVPKLLYEHAGAWGPGHVRHVCFPTRDTVVVTFVTRETPAGVPQRGQMEALLPFRLHALFIDAKDGSLQARREWPSGSEWSQIAAAPNGKVCGHHT
jgi:hypothetical protein